MTNIQIAPSILSADFANMGADVRMLTAAGADMIHCDIIDGHYAPNITFGPGMIEAIRPHTALPLDIHLMVSRPGEWIDLFIAAGADFITFHCEADVHIHRQLLRIKAAGRKAGLVLNPATSLTALEYELDYCDMVLLMSVDPGYGGQSFIESVLPKTEALRKTVDARGLRTEIEVDGGINEHTAKRCIDAGATVLVAGSNVFVAKDVPAQIRLLRGK